MIRSLVLSLTLLLAASSLQGVAASPMPVPTGKGISGIKWGGGPPKFSGGSTNSGGGGSGPPKFTNSKGGPIKGADGFGVSAPKEDAPTGMTKETLPQGQSNFLAVQTFKHISLQVPRSKVLKIFESYLEDQGLGAYTFLCGGGVYRVLNDLSPTTADIDVWATTDSWITETNDAAKEFSGTEDGKKYKLNFDFFNGALGAGMAYYNGAKLYADFANKNVVPLWQSERQWITLYSLPIEWQIQTKMLRMSPWYREGYVHEEKYLKELKHVLALLWFKTKQGQEDSDVLKVEMWLKDYRLLEKSFDYAGGLIQQINSEFEAYKKNGGKFIDNSVERFA
ncbi:hypothetical protein H072_8680 [Dactylellina haptotyla CBS 200.50]|uniref:Uncharacterized protein n=1 Tax=Dactylellina haptotyla (strain CBS 200.50) TaxID=1284197 RepID=S8A950_DACHA|nr:hypothetical protein H072_8680 [Dactylellina haptotyla CBS 200.50]